MLAERWLASNPITSTTWCQSAFAGELQAQNVDPVSVLRKCSVPVPIVWLELIPTSRGPAPG